MLNTSAPLIRACTHQRSSLSTTSDSQRHCPERECVIGHQTRANQLTCDSQDHIVRYDAHESRPPFTLSTKACRRMSLYTNRDRQPVAKSLALNSYLNVCSAFRDSQSQHTKVAGLLPSDDVGSRRFFSSDFCKSMSFLSSTLIL